MAIESRKLKNGQWSHTIRMQYNNVLVKETVRGITKSQAKKVESEIFSNLIKGAYRSLKKTRNPKLRIFAEEYKAGNQMIKKLQECRKNGQAVDAYFRREGVD